MKILKATTPKRRRVTLDLHPEVAKIIERLQRSGLYGVNRTRVVESLFLAGLRAVALPAPEAER